METRMVSSLDKPNLHFDVSAGLKRVLGRELITDDEVAIFEMVKNSFDAGANNVHLYFDDEKIIVADDGSGMTYEDLKSKWLFVAYSSKREGNSGEDYRNRAAERGRYAGSKGVGRFSSDRLGEIITLQTRAMPLDSPVHRMVIDWSRFEADDKQRFDSIPVDHTTIPSFKLPKELSAFGSNLTHGTVIEISILRRRWNREAFQSLKSALAKLINPFGSEADRFTIFITAPGQLAGDEQAEMSARKAGREISARDVINGRVGNFIFSDLREKTTFITVEIGDGKITSSLTDRGELIYKIREPNEYDLLGKADFKCELYYLNHSAKLTFARRVGIPSVQFGSVFLFRNGFRVYPVGEDGHDWFGFDRRKQQGFARFLGSREIIGRVDIAGSDTDFQEASSRNQGLIDSLAVRQLQRCVMEHCLKRLERYVVPVSWVDKADADAEDISRLLTDPGRARVAHAVAKLVDNDHVDLIEYSKRLIGILNERSAGFESSLTSLRAIAGRTNDKNLLVSIDAAERRFEELRRSELEARKVADRERAVAMMATERAIRAEREKEQAQEEVHVERKRAHFLEDVVNIDISRILNLHHQVTIYSVDLNQQIENLLSDTKGKDSIPREDIVRTMEQMAILNRRIQAATKYATMANFKLDSGKITADLPTFFEEYIQKIAVRSSSRRTSITVNNRHPGLSMLFDPMDLSVIVENMISNSKKAEATQINFDLHAGESKSIVMTVTDNGKGLANNVDAGRIFDMGYTTSVGSGLGLYHVRQVLGSMNGSIELDGNHKGRGLAFRIVIASQGARK